ncbi:DNA polymerase III subunit delta [Holzapfeliella sp. He02]|uniref:DNA polymerase III subunit delta n=1 Tax=Holzapfeliella saturejae TaxID=3082953 RepID=A0ABU8SG50_9LACO
MTIRQFLDIKNNQSIQGVLVNTSTELLNHYLIQQLIQKYQKTHGETDVVRFDLAKRGYQGLLDELTQSSLFSSQKILIISDLENLTAKSPAIKNKKALDQLIKLIDSQAITDSYLIFDFNYPKLDERKKITKILKKQLMLIEDRLSYRNLNAFAQYLIEKDDYRIDKQVTNLLVKRADFDITSLMNAIDKLKIAALDTLTISEKLVIDNVEQTLSDNIFDILSLALKKDYQQATQLLKEQLNQGINEVQLVAAMTSQLRFLLQVKLLQEQGQAAKQIESILKAHPYRIKLAIQNPIESSHLIMLIHQLVEIEYQIKSGYQHYDDFLELFLLKC